MIYLKVKWRIFDKGVVVMSDFPEILRTLRNSRKVTQAQLAEALGYGYTAIANYESGRNEPNIDTILKIADYFDVPAGCLLEKDSKIYRLDEELEFVIKKYSQLDREKKEYLLYTLNIL